jgi:hypothetical protein
MLLGFLLGSSVRITTILMDEVINIISGTYQNELKIRSGRRIDKSIKNKILGGKNGSQTNRTRLGWTLFWSKILSFQKKYINRIR